MKGCSLLGLALVSGILSCAQGDELADLKTRLEAQERQITELKEKVLQLERRQQLKERSSSKEIASQESVTEKVGPAQAEKKETWTDRINWSGDLRYRHESFDVENKKDRHRNRIRARVKMDAQVNDEWGMTVRVASGEGDPRSTNQDLDESFSGKEIWLDQAYLSWEPAGWENLRALGGKVANPFYTAGKNQLIWDSDVNPEGIAASTHFDINGQTSVYLNGGGFWVEERSSAADTSLWGIQGYMQHAIGNPTTLIAGASYYDYVHLRGNPDLATSWSGTANFFGNSNSGGNFVNDYNLVEVFAELIAKVGRMPYSVFGSYVVNHGARSGYSGDTGYLVGATLNKAKAPGSWQLGYDYREVGKDAVVGQFSDSDFSGGLTDSRGHRFSAKYQVHKNVQAAATYFVNTINGSSSDMDYNRLQLDLIVKSN